MNCQALPDLIFGATIVALFFVFCRACVRLTK